MIVVTAGSGYLDVDAYASCFAYARMLNHTGIPAVIRTSVPGNETLTPGLIKGDLSLLPMSGSDKADFLKLAGSDLSNADQILYFAPSIEDMCSQLIRKQGTPGEELSYAVMDVSEPAYFEDFALAGRISAVIDHHPGYVNYWKNLLGDQAKIEFIGAAVTLVFEEMEKHGALDCIDPPLARLMMAAILDNTLNFTAGVTNPRDHRVYHKLQHIADTSDFPQLYFSECQAQIEACLVEAIQGDIKHVTGEIYPGLPRHIGQLAVWDVAGLMDRRQEIIDCLNSYGQEWMMNLISLKEGKSYLMAEEPAIQKHLEEKIGGSFIGNQMVLDKAILRKEIKKLFAIAE